MEILTEPIETEPMREHQPRPSRDPALALLRWMELCGLKLDHAKLAKAHAEDAWWAASGEEITGPHRFSEVLLALQKPPRFGT